MDRALELARRGLEEGQLPIGSVVVGGGRMVAEAYWHWEPDRRRLRHPELAALLEADRGDGPPISTLYTTLEPCLLCIGAAATMFVERVVYALPSDLDGAGDVFRAWRPRDDHPAEGVPAAYRVPQVVGGFKASESAELVREYLAGGPTGPIATWARGL
jgi:tRNA(adenine34) deaminase